MFFGLICYSWYLLIKELGKTKEKIKKQQIKYFLLGTSIGFTFGSTNYFLWYGIPIPPYLSILVSMYIVFTALAILKYHLFGIKVILSEILIALIGLILFLEFFIFSEPTYKLLSLSIFILFCIFGYYLIRAIHEETNRIESAENLINEYKKLTKVKDEMFLIGQHHTRTPLTVIRNYSSLLLDESYGPLSEEQKRVVKAIFEKSNEIIGIANLYLDVSKFELGKANLVLEKSDINVLIGQEIKKLEIQAKNKEIEIIFKEKEMPLIEVDKIRISEVIFILLDNAIKYSFPKGKIKINLTKKNNSMIISLQDSGIGMSKEDMVSLFQTPYQRGETAKKIDSTGMGVGLYFAKLIVESHRGKIWAESAGEGKGSNFFIELPLHR